MNKLLIVAEGILDAEEYLDENLSSAESVCNYADACNVFITTKQAEKIINVLKKWTHIRDDFFGDSHAYFLNVTNKL